MKEPPYRATSGEWRRLRKQVWERDRGICQVCGLQVEPQYYELGHKVDRCCGGDDVVDNLCVMCNVCNRHKPPHHTLAEYEQWVAADGWLGEMARAVIQIAHDLESGEFWIKAEPYISRMRDNAQQTG